MKRCSKGYTDDFSGFVKNMETSDYRIRYIVYMQISDAGHCLTLFGPISGFVPLKRVWFSFTILSVKQGIHKLSFLKGVSFWTGRLAMSSVYVLPTIFIPKQLILQCYFEKYFYSVCKKKNELGSYNRVSFLQTGLQNERFLPSTGVKV